MIVDDLDHFDAHAEAVHASVEFAHFRVDDEIADKCLVGVRAVKCPVAIGGHSKNRGVLVGVVVVPRFPCIGLLSESARTVSANVRAAAALEVHNGRCDACKASHVFINDNAVCEAVWTRLRAVSDAVHADAEAVEHDERKVRFERLT